MNATATATLRVWYKLDFDDLDTEAEIDDHAWKAIDPLFKTPITDVEEAAREYADYFHSNRDGWECSWPIDFVVHDGERYFVVSVDREIVHEFRAASDPEPLELVTRSQMRQLITGELVTPEQVEIVNKALRGNDAARTQVVELVKALRAQRKFYEISFDTIGFWAVARDREHVMALMRTWYKNAGDADFDERRSRAEPDIVELTEEQARSKLLFDDDRGSKRYPLSSFEMGALASTEY